MIFISFDSQCKGLINVVDESRWYKRTAAMSNKSLNICLQQLPQFDEWFLFHHLTYKERETLFPQDDIWTFDDVNYILHNC